MPSSAKLLRVGAADRSLLVAALLCGFAALGAFAVPMSAPVEAGLLVEEAQHDFGPVRPGSVLSTTFLLQYDSATASVEVLHVRMGCSCVVPRLKSQTIPPNGTTELEVHFRPPEKAGLAQQLIVVEYRMHDTPRVRSCKLTVRADVRPAFVVSPVSLSFVWSADAVAQTKRLMIKPNPVSGSSQTSPAQIRAVRAAHPAFVATLAEKGSSWQVDVTFDPTRWEKEASVALLKFETDEEGGVTMVVKLNVSRIGTSQKERL